jgi:hypothetical protein
MNNLDNFCSVTKNLLFSSLLRAYECPRFRIYGRVVTGGSTGFEAGDRFVRSTSNTRTGSVKPFAEMGGSGFSERVCSSSVATASETRIWPDLAAEHNRAARFTLRPMAV